MIANIVKTQFFHKIKYDLKGHLIHAAEYYEITKFDLYKDNICLAYYCRYFVSINANIS